MMNFSGSSSPIGSTSSTSWERLATQWRPSSSRSSPHSSENSDADSQFSEESVASSQTSYSSQEQWPLQIQPDPQAPVGKVLSGESCNYLPAAPLPAPQHQHPRRTTARAVAVPSLPRTVERKGQFVYHLVDSATHLVEIVWPTSAPVAHTSQSSCAQSTLPLRTFIEETLRRSKTSFSTLQVALFYLIMLKEHVPSFDFTMEQQVDCPRTRALQCGRRMFLAALILASKYLQDRNFSARAWSKISGLQVNEINLNERAFLAAVNWELHIPEPVFNRWQDILINYSTPKMVGTWRHIVRSLTPELICASNTPTAPFVAPSYNPLDWRSRTLPPLSTTDLLSRSRPALSPLRASSNPVELQFMQHPPAAPVALKLPTPSPMSSACPTPAASCASDLLRYGGRSRAMCSAMSMASSRYCPDLAPPAMGYSGSPSYFSRRSSLATSASSTSVAPSPSSASSPRSPGSMISDHGSSRSSSVASATYPQTTSPFRNCALARLATVNAAHKLVDLGAAAAVMSSDCDDCVTILNSGPLTNGPYSSSPEAIIVEDGSTPLAYDGLRLGESRKRHRYSVDSNTSHDLQDHVRTLMRREHCPSLRSGENLPPTYSGGWAKPAAKKACYMADLTEVTGRDGFARPEGGPGMWAGILSR